MTVYARTPHGVVQAFHGPGLTRRPRIGEVLVSRRTDKRLVVTHFDATNDAIVHYREEATGAHGAFIWTFADGELNRLVAHTEAAE